MTDEEKRQGGPDRRRPSAEDIGTLTELLEAINNLGAEIRRTERRLNGFTTTGEVNARVEQLGAAVAKSIQDNNRRANRRLAVAMIFTLLISLVAIRLSDIRTCQKVNANRLQLRSLLVVVTTPRPGMSAEELARAKAFRETSFRLIPLDDCAFLG